ncbi:hypothetical protein [Micrococcus luteus]
MTDPAPRTAVIVDDHAIFRSGLRADPRSGSWPCPSRTRPRTSSP